MLKLLFTSLILLSFGACVASELTLRDYDEYQIPKGYFLPIISLQEFSALMQMKVIL